MNHTTCLALAVSLGVAQQAAASGFIDDSKANLDLRNFYYNQDTRNTKAASDKEWGQAFMFNYQSGFTQGPVGLGLDLQALYGLRLDASGRAGKAGEDTTPGSVFPLSDGKAANDFSKVGATGKVHLSQTQLKVGTLLPKMPVLMSEDGRLLPQTFRGYQVDSKDLKDVNLVAGKIEQVLDRNSSNSQGMSIGGANDPVKGAFSHQFYYGGVDYTVSKPLQVQYYYASLANFYQQHFVGLVHNWQLPVGQLKTDLRYFYSTADGKNARASGRGEGYVSSGYYGAGVNSGKVDNRLWSALFTYALSGHAVSLGYQKTTGASDFPHINQGQGRSLYLITNAQSLKFINAGEQATVGSYAYDFTGLGIPGLRSSVTYLHGSNIRAAHGDNREWERDVRVDYVIPTGTFKGLGLTWRSAVLRGNDTADKDETRLIVSYSIPLM
ncbi:OprD family outer membrane porin [Pseudomonas fluorescens]|uniref:OprD family outer membrane porin n=1 Tax=Pseudomonas fluorescens TaxID=294 RepID=UPI0016550A4D|nr:OprD family outer membrane porin [Pseudomonas fluorescens]MBC8786647.1 outer membrane porin, OprD family [Pseudomonas fluorescens]